MSLLHATVNGNASNHLMLNIFRIFEMALHKRSFQRFYATACCWIFFFRKFGVGQFSLPASPRRSCQTGRQACAEDLESADGEVDGIGNGESNAIIRSKQIACEWSSSGSIDFLTALVSRLGW